MLRTYRIIISESIDLAAFFQNLGVLNDIASLAATYAVPIGLALAIAYRVYKRIKQLRTLGRFGVQKREDGRPSEVEQDTFFTMLDAELAKAATNVSGKKVNIQ